MNVFEKLRWLARPYEDDEDEENEEFEPAFKQEKRRDRSDRAERAAREESLSPFDAAQADRRSNKVVNIHTTTQLQVVLIKPDRFETGRDIADHLRDKHTVVFNLDSVGKDVARRLLDFISGVAYASGGRVQPVAGGTYIATPFNVDLVGGDLVDQLENNGLYNF